MISSSSVLPFSATTLPLYPLHFTSVAAVFIPVRFWYLRSCYPQCNIRSKYFKSLVAYSITRTSLCIAAAWFEEASSNSLLYARNDWLCTSSTKYLFPTTVRKNSWGLFSSTTSCIKASSIRTYWFFLDVIWSSAFQYLNRQEALTGHISPFRRSIAGNISSRAFTSHNSNRSSAEFNGEADGGSFALPSPSWQISELY